MPAITIDGKEVLVVPPKYPSTEVKITLGGRWDPGHKAWRLAPTSLNVLSLVDMYGKEILKGAPWLVRHLAMADWGFTGFATQDDYHQMLSARALEHPRWRDLYEFQQEAVEYMVCNPHRGCVLALSPGLGKTPTSVVAADVLQLNKILVVAPLTLAKNWIAEFERWTQYYRSWSRTTAKNRTPATECVVCNHEVLWEVVFKDEHGAIITVPGGPRKQKQWVEEGPKVHDTKRDKMVPARKRIVRLARAYDQDWDLVIIDESILLKNRKAVKVDIVSELAKYAGQVWLLSGSPTAKFRADLYPQVKTIMPRGFPSYWRFVEFFCVVDKEGWGWSIEADRPDHDPQSYLRDFVFVRNQKDVLPELPDYIYDPIEVDLLPVQERAFREMSDNWQTELESGKRIGADIKLAQLSRLAQITSNMCNLESGSGAVIASAKEDLLITLIAEGEIEFPLLVWTWWVPTSQSVYDRLYDHTDLAVDVVTGSMKGWEKDEILDDYKAGELDVLVLQMGVGKFGHTLTDTRTVFYHDRHWDSDAYLQSLRRVKRIGLNHRPRLIVPRAPVSMDPVVELNLAGKLSSVAKVANHDLRELLNSLGSGNVPWELDEGNFDL